MLVKAEKRSCNKQKRQWRLQIQPRTKLKRKTINFLTPRRSWDLRGTDVVQKETFAISLMPEPIKYGDGERVEVFAWKIFEAYRKFLDFGRKFRQKLKNDLDSRLNKKRVQSLNGRFYAMYCRDPAAVVRDRVADKNLDDIITTFFAGPCINHSMNVEIGKKKHFKRWPEQWRCQQTHQYHWKKADIHVHSRL